MKRKVEEEKKKILWISPESHNILKYLSYHYNMSMRAIVDKLTQDESDKFDHERFKYLEENHNVWDGK